MLLQLTTLVTAIILSIGFVSCDFDYEIPDLTLKAYTPSGLEASIPDSPKIKLFAFHAKINKNISNAEPGDYYKDVGQAENGRWVFWDSTIKLDIDDVISYWVFVQYDKLGFRKDVLNWKVEKLHTRNTCNKNSLTLLNGVKTCIGDLIFEDEFNNIHIDENKWLIEHRIPNPTQGPDFEFVSYRNDKDVCYTKNDLLFIKPRIENNVRGVLDLSDKCTSVNTNECSFKQQYYQILPPVTSGNIYSKFNFTYGVFEIKAKLPAGEWIYPQLYLRHLGQTFYKIFVAYTRGNEELVGNSNDDIGAHLLFGGPVEDPTEPKKSMFLRSIRSGTPYTNQMHVCKLKWESNKMTFYVDGVEFGKVDVTFDKPVVINLGVGVGGINDFPDGYVSNKERNQKPWQNGDPKQVKLFYKAKDIWSSTWKGENSALQVDYVKVWAI